MSEMKRSMMLPLWLGLALLAGCATGPKPLAVFSARPESRNAGAGPAASPPLVVRLSPEKDGLSAMAMSGGPLQSAVLMGEARRDGETWRLSLTELKWFNNWANGWTEASFLLEGSARLEPGTEASGWILKIEEAPQLDSVESGAIRYFNTYLRDAKGRTEFSHRWDRIQAVSIDLLTRSSVQELLGDPGMLRRELSPRKRVDASPDSLVEPLRILRDGGTLLRDYKESPGLWSLAIAWKGYWEQAEIPMVVRKK
jgi:hypothetical protein